MVRPTPRSFTAYGLLADCPGFPASAGLGFRRDYLCEGDTRLDFKYLDRGLCYTIGFRHPNFHPMTADPPGVWNIQTADLGTGTPRANSAGLPAVPHQTVYSLEDLAVRRRSGLRMAYLSYISRTALEDAKAVIAGKSTRPFNYRFILRSRNPEATGVYSDILCESPLLRRVRQLVYQHPSRQIREEIDVAAGVLRPQGVPPPRPTGMTSWPSSQSSSHASRSTSSS